MRSHLRTILAAVLMVGLLAIFLRHANLGQVWIEIRHARGALLLAAFGATALTYVIRALRWQYLLKPIGPTRFANALRATIIGFAATSVLPARVGELLRPYLLARRENLSATATFATIVIERLLDTVTVLVLFALFLVAFDPGMAAVDARTFRAIQIGGVAVGAAAVGALVLVFVLAGHPEMLERLAARLEAVLPRRLAGGLARLAGLFAAGFAVVRQPTHLVTAIVLSFPLWLSIAAGVWWVSQAFQIAMPFSGSFLLLALLVVGVAVPTPGAIGGFHEAFRIGAVTFYGAPNDRGVGAAIVLHAISFVPVAVVGSLLMAQEGLSLGRVRRLARGAGAEAGPGEMSLLRPSGR